MEIEFKNLYKKLQSIDKLEKSLERLEKMNQNNRPLTEKEQEMLDSLIHKAQEKAEKMSDRTLEETTNEVRKNLKSISEYIQRMEENKSREIG